MLKSYVAMFKSISDSVPSCFKKRIRIQQNNVQNKYQLKKAVPYKDKVRMSLRFTSPAFLNTNINYSFPVSAV